MNTINIFRIGYTWYEGEHSETLLAKNVERKEFEKDLVKAKNFAVSLIGKKIKKGEYLGKGYRVECLPEYYEQIIWFLIKKLKYMECNYTEDIDYDVCDYSYKEIRINKSEKKIDISELKC